MTTRVNIDAEQLAATMEEVRELRAATGPGRLLAWLRQENEELMEMDDPARGQNSATTRGWTP